MVLYLGSERMRFHYRNSCVWAWVVVMDSVSVLSTESGKKRDIVQRILEKDGLYAERRK